MIVCETLAQAHAVVGVTHIEVGEEIRAYVEGDVLPAHLVPPALPLARASLVIKIDRDADAIIGAVIGGRGLEYERAEREAQAFVDGGYAGTAGAMVTGWATAKGWTSNAAADDILNAAAAWRGAQAALRAARLLRKEQARVAVDLAACATIEAAWNAFATALRAQLVT